MVATDTALSINKFTPKSYWYVQLDWDKYDQGNIPWYLLNLHDEDVTVVYCGDERETVFMVNESEFKILNILWQH